MMKFNISNGVHYSKYCGVRHSAPRNKGVFDGTIFAAYRSYAAKEFIYT